MNPKQWNDLYPNIGMKEVYSPTVLKKVKESNYRIHYIDFDLVELLQVLRNEVGPIYINKGRSVRRAYRSPKENFQIYKDHRFSFHMAGKAADITAKEVKPKELIDVMARIRHRGFRFTGLGIYRTFVHGDIRPWLGEGFAFWDMR